MRKFIPLFTLMTAAFLASAVIGCSGRNAKTIYHERRADSFFKSGGFDKAEIEYMNVLRNDSENAHAFGQLGIIYYEEGRMQRAAPFLFKAVQMDTNNFELRTRLGFIYQSVGKLKEARDAAEFVLRRKPTDAEAPLLLAQVAQMDGKTEDAKKQLQQLAKSHDTAGIEVALGTIALHDGDLDAAETALQRGRSLDSQSNPEIYSALGNLALAKNDLRQAKTYFSTAAEIAPPRSPQRLQYAQFLLKTGDSASAKKILEETTAKTPDYVPAWVGRAEIALTEKNFDDCENLINTALQHDADNYQALLLASQLDFARGNTTKSIADLDRMAKMFPQAAHVQYQLGLAYLADGQKDNAVNCLTRAVTMQTNFTDATVLLAGIQIKTGNPLPAIVLLKNLLQRQPQNSQAQLLLAEGNRVQGNSADAIAIYENLEKRFPTNSQLPLLKGAAFLQDQKFDDARREFSRAFQMNPHNLMAAAQLVDLDLIGKQFDEAQKLADKIAAENPKSADPLLLQAKIALAQADTNRAASILWKAVNRFPHESNPPLLLAQIYFDSAQTDKATALLENVLARDTNNISAMMLTARIETEKKNFQPAADIYEKVIALNPKFSPALNNLAVLYCDNLNQLDKALDLAQRAHQLLPFNPSTADTLGWVLSRKGNYSAALNLLQDAATKSPAEPEIQFHLGKTLYLMGKESPARAAFALAAESEKSFLDRAECNQCLAILAIDPATAGSPERDQLEKRIAAQPDDAAASARLAAIYNRIGAAGKAMQTDEAALKANSQNVRAMIDLAQLCAAKDFSRAMDLAKSAYKISPDDATVCATLGRFAFQSGNWTWSLTLLQQANQNQPNSPEILFDLANANYAVGKISDAQSQMQAALAAGLPAAKSADAKRFLNFTTAVTFENAGSKETDAQQILKSQPDYVPALMIVAMSAQQKSQIETAQQSYEKILNRFPAFAPAQKQLAILEAKNPAMASKAFALGMKALENFPNDTELAKVLGVLSFQQGDYVRAENFLETAAQAASPDADVLYYLGAAQFHLKNRAESKTALQRALELNLSGQHANDAKKLLAELK